MCWQISDNSAWVSVCLRILQTEVMTASILYYFLKDIPSACSLGRWDVALWEGLIVALEHRIFNA